MTAKDPLQGKIVYVLIMTILVQFLYPLSVSPNPFVTIAFQIFYMTLFVAGIYMVSDNRLFTYLLIIAAIS